jgi:hypothetical protein
MSNSTVRVRRHRDREKRDEIVLTISANRTALVDRLIDVGLLRADVEHDQAAIANATEHIVRCFSFEKPAGGC